MIHEWYRYYRLRNSAILNFEFMGADRNTQHSIL